jgi:hypothetical protein
MTVWADAAADLFDDTALGEDAEYRVSGHGPAITVRVIRSAPDDIALALGQSIRVPTLLLEVQASELTPRKNGSFTLADGTVGTVLDCARDVEGVTWKVTCRRGGYSDE